ncbi:hypothetical protein NEAUS04_0680 [Nematocida ausubeli]|nr:hypothetical protein NEAUS07_0934 [Nematocida ausubeli]KAI5147715.1 hypothetical protein NEAUS05_1004 [Nematocida ausubeli]KAI5161721.1 hypothetical protein NEAUS04_0680 [Nematocida ausubeli]
MEVFVQEFKTLQKVIYKSKNAHRCTLYYKHTVHVSRLIKKYLSTDGTKKIKDLLLSDIQDKCMTAYVSLSSNIAQGHNLALSIGLMAIIAKLYSTSKKLNYTDAVQATSYIVHDIESSSEKDEISDIFK